MKQNKWDASFYAKYSKGQEVWAKELIEKVPLDYQKRVHVRMVRLEVVAQKLNL